jgi:hypothetical protein
MKKLLTTMAALAILGLVAPAVAQWVPLAENPAWWPYGDYPLNVGGQPSPSLATLGLTEYSGETFYNTPGYAPRSNAGGVFANEQFYTIGGYGAFSLDQGGGAMYHNNRQSGNDIYDPNTNTWSSSKYDGTGPLGYNNGGGAAMPTVGQGTYIGTSQTVAANVDGDATLEILVHGGYPIWSGAFGIYDPDTDTWSNSAAALAFPGGGFTAQYLGAAREVGGKVYCLGGYYWGQTGINGQAYDIATNTWTVVGEDMLPGAAAGQFSAAVVGTDIYLLGGVGASTQILKYDTVANTLTDTGDTLLKGVLRSAAVVWGGKIIVLGGEGPNGGNVPTTQVYDPVTGTVKYGRNLPIGMSRLAADIDPLTGRIYLGGTYEGTNIVGDYNGNDLWCASANWVVPEPGVMALFGFGLLALLGLRRRK